MECLLEFVAYVVSKVAGNCGHEERGGRERVLVFLSVRVQISERASGLAVSVVLRHVFIRRGRE